MFKRYKVEAITVIVVLLLVASIFVAGLYGQAQYRLGYDGGAMSIIVKFNAGESIDYTNLAGENYVITFDIVDKYENLTLEDPGVCSTCHKYSTEYYKKKGGNLS